jgi:hypothetical protein
MNLGLSTEFSGSFSKPLPTFGAGVGSTHRKVSSYREGCGQTPSGFEPTIPEFKRRRPRNPELIAENAGRHAS